MCLKYKVNLFTGNRLRSGLNHKEMGPEYRREEVEIYDEIPAEAVRKLIESNVDALLLYDVEEPTHPALELYRQVLLAFHRGDANAIARLQGEQEVNSELRIAIELRRQICSGAVDPKFIEEISKQKHQIGWLGEILILAAAAQEILGDFSSARELHRRAAKALLQIGAKGKSLRARSNMVANLSNIEPDRKLIPEYLSLVREARKLRQHNIMATCLLNLSREYQKLGARKIALRYCQRAFAAIKGDPGGQIYFLVLVHRAHLLFELGRSVEAKVDAEQASAADFPSVQSALAALRTIMGETAAPENPMLRTWQERLNEFRSGKALTLSPVEEKLVSFLTEGREKFEIADHLFGRDLDPLKAENRVKNLLHRIRKKFPGLIHLDGDRYFLADSELKGKAQ